MKTLELKGSPYEMGMKQGKSFPKEIKDIYEDTYKNSIANRKISEDKIQLVRETVRKSLTKTAPQLLEEMDGIADGAGMKRDDIFLLNTWPIVVYAVGLTSCSSMVVAQSDRGPLLGQNADLGMRDSYFVGIHRPAHGYASITARFFGTVWFMGGGINEHGLCMGGSGVNGVKRDEKWEEGFPGLFLSLLVMGNCRNVSEAVILFQKYKPMIPLECGQDHSLADKDGHIAVVEKLASKTAVRYADNGVLFTANFFAHRDMEPLNDHSTEYVRSLESNARERYWRIGETFKNGDYSFKTVKSLLSAHEYPGALCRHCDTVKDEIGYTKISCISIPREKRILISDNAPCRSAYVEYRL
jgi:isopenicillin-N N-acyltransferase like protein